MSVPVWSQLKRGVGVNIELKADQPTGKLTTGYVGQLLGSGNHPRGIKVRLMDGQVGRVKSLTSLPPIDIKSDTPDEVTLFERQFGKAMGKQDGRRKSREEYRMQHDYREDETAPDARNLEDYIVVKPKKTNKKSRPASQPVNTQAQDVSAQDMMEQEFPSLDSTLIAATLSEHSTIEAARQTFRALT
ncbi:uncharacterized protein KY384_003354 [Bacidia gigantensis]|uniref:uncharacterized protein n=1 Tax=Bacidia gigantensis TaxID=2732470 RepID=UPI001D04B4B5|nr:uncharacterized protein KY384_003354 [Bacidia gigantensis]KAG8531722.1 hypothetical protein KY384_003354 [Bacidia gigantensis]